MKLLNGQIATEQSRLSQHGDQLVVDTPQGDLTLRCTIDRPTLTAERYELLDSRGTVDPSQDHYLTTTALKGRTVGPDPT